MEETKRSKLETEQTGIGSAFEREKEKSVGRFYQ